MKASLKKIIALIACLCLVLPSAVLFATAEDSSATISFADKANRTSYSTSQQVWKQNGITVTNDKGASTSNVGDYANPGRFYKSSTVTIEYPGMTKLVINSVVYSDNNYATPWTDSFTDSNATATINDSTVTILFAEPVNSFTFEKMSAQARAYDITVYSGDAPAIPDQPVDPDVPDEDPEADTELSVADAIALGLSKAHNTYTEGKYFVTGVITEVYQTTYGNMYITDEAGNVLTIYGTYSADGADRYDVMDVKPAAGDTVTIYGIVGQYNNVAQIKNGWIVDHVAGNGETPDVPVNPPVDPDVPAATVVTNPVAGVAYKLGMDQTEKGAIYYFIGEMSSYYGATDTDLSKAVDMYLETAEGGYKLYFNDANGAKQYINLVQSGTHYNFTFGAEGSVFTLDAEKNALCAPCGDQICYMGTYGTYVTVGTLTTEKLQDTDYIARLYSVGGEIPEQPDQPDLPTGDTLTIEEAIALALSMDHNVYTEAKYYVTGVITEVYNETYGNMRLTDDAGNILTIYGSYSADGADRYDAMAVKPVAGDTVTIYGIVGQYNGTPQIKNGWIVEHTAAGGETPEQPEQPDEPEQPEQPVTGVVTNPVAGVAYKLGLDQIEKGSVYYFIGEMSGYYGATDTDVSKAVDMYLENAEGGYKLYFTDANGAKQYIKLEQSGTHYNFTFGAEGSVFTLDAEKNALCAPAGDQICYMGTYGSYVTVGTLTTEKLQDSDYIARLYSVSTETPDEPEQPGEAPSTGDNSTVYVTLAVVLMALAAAAVVLTSKKRA